MTLPAELDLMQSGFNSHARSRGAYAGTLEGVPASTFVKTNGNLPLTTNAQAFGNTVASNATGPLRGVYTEFLATGGYDMTSQHRIFVITFQWNSPNRIQVTTAANDGVVMRLATGSGSPPSNYRTWQIAGNDKAAASARANAKAVVIDMEDTTYDATIGTWDNTDVQCFGMGTVRFNISGTSANQYYFQRTWAFTTTKGSADIPTFTGSSSWDQLTSLLDGTDYTDKISDDWAKREGSVYSLACPISFGDGSTAVTFDDAGASVFWSDSNSSVDPRIRVTEDAFRVHADLRNNAADTLTLSGKYNAGNSNPPWDFDLDFACAITITGASFKNIGLFTMGSSVVGAATFDGCKEIQINNTGADLDGSSFKNPIGSHLLVLNV